MNTLSCCCSCCAQRVVDNVVLSALDGLDPIRDLEVEFPGFRAHWLRHVYELFNEETGQSFFVEYFGEPIILGTRSNYDEDVE